MIYCISDIHGEYDLFLKMLDVIKLKEDDTLYILGDVLDRGPDPIKALMHIMGMQNAKFIIGNHELMALEVMSKGFDNLVTAEMKSLDDDTFLKLMNWYRNGCGSTVTQFKALDDGKRRDIEEYLKNSLAYEKLEVNGQKFLLLHAGLMNFAPERDITDYSLYELVWARPDLSKPYFEDTYTVMGHTPTQIIEDFDTPGRIFKKNNHIVIDCGASMGGNLACLRLDDMKEFYV